MGQDDQGIIRAKLNAENAARTMVETLVSLGVSEKEIADAIEHVRHEGRNKSNF
jgi:Holliday junction resolvasome RuvABC DNA-binding subunit